jgi:glutamate---cysteine ligase / carboxylate-amine ligase
VTEAAWGSVLTLGVEEELMLVDAETLTQRPASSEVIPRVQAERGLVKHELFESIVELNSGVCDSPDEALDVVRALRRATAEAAGAVGCTVAAVGSHPTDIASEQEIADEPHYRDFVEYAGLTARRQGVQGLHVHVGMPDAETCLRVLERVIPWLPLVLALSANSPWFEGERTGLLSTRAEILGLLPRHGAPPRFESWSDWERLIRRFCDSGVVDSYTAIHWDVRPHPK